MASKSNHAGPRTLGAPTPEAQVPAAELLLRSGALWTTHFLLVQHRSSLITPPRSSVVSFPLLGLPKEYRCKLSQQLCELANRNRSGRKHAAAKIGEMARRAVRGNGQPGGQRRRTTSDDLDSFPLLL